MCLASWVESYVSVSISSVISFRRYGLCLMRLSIVLCDGVVDVVCLYSCRAKLSLVSGDESWLVLFFAKSIALAMMHWLN